MQKIMFNDRFGLTKAVLEGRKTMTRRLVNLNRVSTLIPGRVKECYLDCSPFKVGEVVAVAQSYKEIREKYGIRSPIEYINRDRYEKSAGWNNKMFVRASLMPNKIRITKVRIERLQDISDEDCIREGLAVDKESGSLSLYGWERADKSGEFFATPQLAFAALIDKVSGKGVWKSNPWVFVYEFELVK